MQLCLWSFGVSFIGFFGFWLFFFLNLDHNMRFFKVSSFNLCFSYLQKSCCYLACNKLGGRRLLSNKSYCW